MSKSISAILGGAILLTGVASAAQAGGLERGGYNYDLLFSEDRFASEAGVIYVMPNRKIKNAQGLNAGGKSSVSETENYTIPRVGVKVGITQDLDCLAQYSQPWGVHTNPGEDWKGSNQNIETKIESHDYGLTCSYKFDVGKGFIRALGGVSYQKVEGFKERLVDPRVKPLGFSGNGRLELEGDGVGWRIGAAYEIPEIALRASLIYNAEVDLGDVTGTLDLTGLPAVGGPLGKVTDVYGTATMPQSLEFKFQTGIAPDWLAFGSVKWVDWSVLGVVPFCAQATKDVVACGPNSLAKLTSIDLMFRDGWTVAAGIGHKFNDQWSGQVQVSWDRGTSTGLTTQTDTWLLSSGVSWSPNKNVELRVGGAVGMLTSGSYGPTKCSVDTGCGEDAKYDFGDDFVSALSISGKLKF
jgi:long-chain fatty acid transport protein